MKKLILLLAVTIFCSCSSADEVVEKFQEVDVIRGGCFISFLQNNVFTIDVCSAKITMINGTGDANFTVNITPSDINKLYNVVIKTENLGFPEFSVGGESSVEGVSRVFSHQITFFDEFLTLENGAETPRKGHIIIQIEDPEVGLLSQEIKIPVDVVVFP